MYDLDDTDEEPIDVTPDFMKHEDEAPETEVDIETSRDGGDEGENREQLDLASDGQGRHADAPPR